MLLVIHAAVTLLFLILGIVLRRGKGAFLIAGYNTAGPEERAKYDERALCRATGSLMFVLAGCWVIIALSEVFDRISLLWIGLGLFLLITILGIIYLNTSKKVKRK